MLIADAPDRAKADMSHPGWRWIRLLCGAALLVLVIWRLGTGPFLAGLRTINARALAAAVGITALTTLCSAWRWTMVAGGLGVGLPLRVGVAAYYRSQFLNLTLPGGVVGDVHRAVSHGRDVGDVGLGLRAVVWERSGGQFVQIVLTLIVLLVLPSPVRSWMPVVLALVAAVVLAVLVAVPLIRARLHRGPGRAARILRTVADDLRHGLLAQRTWPGITIASALVVAGHTAVFLIATQTAGSTAPTLQLLPIALLVLLAMGIPTNIGGWGPREGMAAWAFGAAGLGAAQGVAAAVVYGVMALVATLPGAGVLAVTWLRGGRRRTPADPRTPAEASAKGPPGG